MANARYDEFAKQVLLGNIDMEDDTIKIVLIDTNDYTFDADLHRNLSDIPAIARIATATVVGITVANDGVVDAPDLTISSVSGDSVEACIIYKDTGTESTSTLLLYIDSGSGFPYTPNNGNVNINFNNGANKIFKL